MKVELEKLKLGHSPLTDSVFVGIAKNGKEWQNKHNVTNDFIACVISKWEGRIEEITDGTNTWVISVKKQKANPLTKQSKPITK